MKRIGKATLVLGTMTLIGLGCSKDGENPLPQDQELTQVEVKTVLEIDDYSSIADGVLTDLFQGNESGKSSKMEECYEAVYSNTGFTVSFEDCAIDGSEKVNGSLIVIYEEGEESTSFTATYNDLSVGGVVINGTRSFTLDTGSAENSVYFTIVSDMIITLADDSVIQENGNKTFGVVIDSENFEDSAITIDGNWTVKEDGNTYTVNVSSTMRATFSCTYFAQGTITLSKNGLAVIVDYGDGTCDDVATIEYPDGTIEEFKL